MKKITNEDVIMLIKMQALIKSACKHLYNNKEKRNKKIRVGNYYITYDDFVKFNEFIDTRFKGGK